MNLRRNLLAATITSLLCFSQNALSAGEVDATITLNDITRNVTFASQDKLNAILDGTASAQEQLNLGSLFVNPANACTGVGCNTDSTGTPTKLNGVRVATTFNNVPVTVVKVDPTTAVISQDVIDPVTGERSTQITTLQRTIGQPISDASGNTVSLDTVIGAYLNVITGADKTALAGLNLPADVQNKLVLDGVSPTTQAALITLLAKPAEIKGTGVVSADGSATADNSPAAIAQAALDKEVASSFLNSVASTTATTPVSANVTALASTFTSNSTGKNALLLSQYVTQTKYVAATTVQNDPTLDTSVVNLLVATAAVDNTKANQQLVTYLAANGGSVAELKAATTALNTALTQTNAATAAVKDDPNAASIVAAAQTAATSALAAQKAATTAIKNNPNASPEDKAAADKALADAQKTVDTVNNVVSVGSIGTALAKAEKALRNTKTATQVINAREELKKVRGAANTVLAADSTATAAQKADATKVLQTLANTGTAEYYARHTSANGIAGNPSSMMGMNVDQMFAQAQDVNNTTIASGTTASGMQHAIGASVQYNYYNLAGTNVNTVSLPLSYTAKVNSKSQVIVSVPLSYINEGNNDSYQYGAGIAFKYNVTDRWTLTPALSYSERTADATDFNDYYAKRALGDGVSMFGGGLSSKYDWNYQDMKISMTNMGSYFAVADGFGATNPQARGYSNDLGNFVLKNGINVGKSIAGFTMSTYFNDVEYFGSELFFDQYNEFGFALKPENMGALNALSINANYLFSFNEGRKGDLDGFKVNIGYQF